MFVGDTIHFHSTCGVGVPVERIWSKYGQVHAVTDSACVSYASKAHSAKYFRKHLRNAVLDLIARRNQCCERFLNGNDELKEA